MPQWVTVEVVRQTKMSHRHQSVSYVTHCVGAQNNTGPHLAWAGRRAGLQDPAAPGRRSSAAAWLTSLHPTCFSLLAVLRKAVTSAKASMPAPAQHFAGQSLKGG